MAEVKKEEKKDDKKVLLIDQARMLRMKDVLDMWPVSRSFINRLIKEKKDPLPSYTFRRTRFFRYDELMWYLDKHKTK